MGDDNSKDHTVIDLKTVYRSQNEEIQPDITVVRYSNLSYIQCSPRDVVIDFLELPGVKKEGKVLVNGTRIYMSHVAAQKFAEALNGILKKVHDSGEMETYTIPNSSKERKLSSKAKLSIDKKQA